MIGPVVVVHIAEDGAFRYLVHGEARLLIVDERAPHDRVYEITDQVPAQEIANVLRDDAIGSRNDDRHEAISARILTFINGRPHLRVVE